jgi:hypothetical protein
LVPVTPKLPVRENVIRIEYKNHEDPYWTVELPADIDRIYEAISRESKEARRPVTARYFYPDGSSFDAPLEEASYSHACGLGLYFYGRDKVLYEISGHPGSFWLELRYSGEADIYNAALSAIVQDNCRRSPSYRKDYPKE